MNDDIMKHCTYSQDMVYCDGTHIMSSCVIARGRYKGFDFVAINIGGRHPCGYVNVRDTEFNRKDYDEINVECHGGLTFANEKLSLVDETGWWIGWDYAHFGDYEPSLAAGKRYTTEEVVADCLDVIDQIGGAASKSAIKSDYKKHAEHILAHYASARKANPRFCNSVLPNALPQGCFKKRLHIIRKTLDDLVRSECVYPEILFDCGIAELCDAIERKDAKHAVEKCYDIAADALRMADVIEGRQKLGKPKEA